MKKEMAEARFWKNVDVGGADECWEWSGSRNIQGYGEFNCYSTRTFAHRFSYRIQHGAIPPGLVVMHSCDNPPCVNPSHLSIGTKQDNTMDSVNKGRWLSEKRRRVYAEGRNQPRGKRPPTPAAEKP